MIWLSRRVAVPLPQRSIPHHDACPEPARGTTMALDVTAQIEILATIKDLNSAAMCITHDLAVVPQVADRIMVLRHGDLVEEGRTEFLRANLRRSTPREFLSIRRGNGERVAHPEMVPRLARHSSRNTCRCSSARGRAHARTGMRHDRHPPNPKVKGGNA